MDTIESGWESAWTENMGPADKIFLKRMEVSIALLDKEILERVHCADLWAIVRATVRAYVPRVDDAPPEKPAQLYYKGIPIKEDKEMIVKEIFKFNQWLRRHTSPDDINDYNRKIPATVHKADKELELAFKTNNVMHIKNAEIVWKNILELYEDEK